MPDQVPDAVDTEWRGTWWRPSDPDVVIAGTLVQQGGTGDILLRLVGGFVDPPGEPGPVDLHTDGVFPVVLGVSGTERFTLLDCTMLSTISPFPGTPREQDISVLRALRGVHLADPAEPIFESLAVTIEYLLGWMGPSSFSITLEHERGVGWAGKQSAHSTPIEDITVHHGSFDYTFGVHYTQFAYEHQARANRRIMRNQEWAEIRIKADETVCYDGFDGSVKAIMDLLTLAAHAPAGAIEQTLVYGASESHPVSAGRSRGEVEIIGRPIHRPVQGDRETALVQYLFTLQDVELTDLLPKWLSIHERAELACSLLFGLQYVPSGYTPSRLLTVATAAESLHRKLYPDETHVSQDVYEAIIARIRAALDGPDDESKTGRGLLGDQMSRNEPYFRERMQSLAGRPDQEAVAALVSDVPKWAKFLKDQRNGMAHGIREPIEGKSGRMMFDTLEVTAALLGLVLLSELGVSADVQRRASAMPHIAFMAREFNKALPDV